VPRKIFKGFKKACHTLYKFDSLPELDFARLCERDPAVLKWLRPATSQFDIWWGKDRRRYEPDFVVETADRIYLVEIKASNEVNNADVQEKGRAGAEYCKNVSAYNAELDESGKPKGKPWEYVLIGVDKESMPPNYTFEVVISGKTPIEFLAEQQ